MKKFVIVVMLFATPAIAQPVQPVPQEAELNFKLTTTDINVIGQALGKAPYEQAAPILQKLREQYFNLQAKAAVKPEIKPEENKDNEKK